MMKKLLALFVLTVAVILVLASCDTQHVHSFGEWEILKPATCVSEGERARYCDCGEKQTETVYMTGIHTEVVDEAVAPTCTEGGKTEGKHCSVCNTVLVEQSEIEATGHNEVIDVAVDATCSTVGKTEGKHCSTCGEVLVAQNDIPTIAHTYGDWVVTKIANCTQNGEKERYCTCGDKQTETIDGAGMHTEIIDSAVTPTCTSTGLTEGKHCSNCDAVLVEQEIIPTLEHNYQSAYSHDNSFHWHKCNDCDAINGKAEHTFDDAGVCTVCLEPISATEGIVYDISDDGNYAMVLAYNGSATKIKIADTYEGLPVTTIYENAFKDNDKITAVIIPDSITSIGVKALSGCKSLTSIVIPENITNIGDYAFSGCTSLTSIVIPESITNIVSGAFSGCTSLTSIVIPDSVRSIGENAFNGCSSLTSVVIPNSVTSIGGRAFKGCNGLTSIVIPDSVVRIGDYAFSDCSKLVSVVFPDSLISIGYCAFNCCFSLSSVVLPDSLTSIGGKAFINCFSLQFNEYENGKYIGSDDNPYFALVEVTSNDMNSYTIHEDTKIIADYVFSGCTRLSSITIPDKVISIGDYAFSSCSSLTSVVFGDSLTSIGDYAFNGCSNLVSVVLPDSLTFIDTSTFYGCSNLQFNEYENCKYLGSDDNPYFALVMIATNGLSSYTIHEDTKIIANYTFSGCTRLSSITIPDKVTSIGDYAFSGCTSMVSVGFSKGLISIGDYAFYNCYDLNSVVFGDSLTSIGDYAFYNCYNLKSVYYAGSEEEWQSITINERNDRLDSATKHYNYVPENE